ncbi:MAG TPA: hypothetical protein VFO73_02355 [Candidatus Limnocylindrales bacterium]|nr:hypothetical protein [Candidatus Limnocylindrales bacterium]
MPGLSFPILALIASAILFAPLASWLALQRARSWALWFLFGVALGPVASLLLVLAPPGRCPACGTPSIGWPRSCTNCGLVFGSGLPGSARPSMAISPAAAPDGARGVAAAAPRARAVEPTPAVPDPSDAVPAHRPATALGRRAMLDAAEQVPPRALPAEELPRTPAAAATRRAAPTGSLVVLGSGVFIGGSQHSLQIGSRYLLARVGAELHVLGPVHISPAAVAARIPLAGVEPSLLADRLLISPTRPGRGSDLAFGGVSFERDVDIVRDLRAPRKGRSAAT